MAKVDRATLYGYFNTGDKPTELQFVDLVDSSPNFSDDNIHVTIGSSGNYATINAAIVAGKYNLKLISDITEISDSTVPEGNILIISGGGFEIDFATFNITFSYTALKSSLLIESTIITYAFTGAKILFDFDTGNIALIQNCVNNNNSTIGDTPILNLDQLNRCIVKGCVISLPNFAVTLFEGTDATLLTHTLKDCEINGGGASCQPFGTWGFGGFLSNIIFLGTFGSVEFAVSKVANIRGDAVISLLIVGRNGSHTLDHCEVTNIDLPNATLFVYCISGYATKITNGSFKDFNSGTNSINNLGVSLCNISFNNATTINTKNSQFLNCIFESTLSITGDVVTLTNCRLNETVTITGDNNTLNSCNAGNANAGAKTITISGTADKTIVASCRTEASIVNSGTNTALLNNLLF